LAKSIFLFAIRGYALLSNADPDDFWGKFEVNVKGVCHCGREFLAVESKDPIMINVSSCVGDLPPRPGLSAYLASKLAGPKG